MEGWVKLHRKFLNWEWYDDINTKVLFLHLLLKANHEKKQWKGITIEPGQLVTSYQNLAIETGLSVKKIRVSIFKLCRTNEVAHKGQSLYSIITIKNWNQYQEKGKQNGKQGASEGQQLKNERNILINKLINIIGELNFSENYLTSVQEWIEYKKARRESYKTDKSLEAFIKKLAKLSDNCPEKAALIVEQSIANNWAGIFELKDEKKDQPKNDGPNYGPVVTEGSLGF